MPTTLIQSCGGDEGQAGGQQPEDGLPGGQQPPDQRAKNHHEQNKKSGALRF
jgi:hypothetical protein